MEIRIKVTTGAKKDEIEKLKDGRLAICVRAKREQGLANEAVLTLVAKYFNVAKSAVAITKGARLANKIITIKGYSK